MMTVDLPEDRERSLRDEVSSGHLASLDDAMAEAARLLRRQLREGPAESTGAASREAPGASHQEPI